MWPEVQTLRHLLIWDGFDAVSFPNDIVAMPRPANPELPGRILDAALHLFSEQGYRAVSMAGIAEAAGISKANLFHYFATKEQLALAVVHHSKLLADATLRSRFEAPGSDPIEDIRAMFSVQASAAPSKFFGTIANDMANSSPQLKAEVSGMLAAWTQGVADLLERGKQNGHFVGEMPTLDVASGIIDLWQGAMLRHDLMGDEKAFENAGAMAVNFLEKFSSD